MKGIFENNDLTVTAKQVRGFKGYPPMFHTHMEIVYVLSGRIEMQIDGMAHTLLPGQLSVSFPYVIHSYENSPEAEAMILLFSPGVVPSWERQLMSCKPVVPYMENTADFLPLLEKITQHCREDREQLARDYLAALVGELLLASPMEAVSGTDLTVTQRTLVFCAENFRRDIGLKDVAEGLHVSESHISKIFARKLGCSFRSYINALRVAEVKKQLKTTDRKIIDIMYDCGFRNQSSFNQVFADAVGMSPRDYRNRHRQKKSVSIT